jgi:enoyl-CoA hydratase/carnithine racemase
MTYEAILTETRDRVGIITLIHPKQLMRMQLNA